MLRVFCLFFILLTLTACGDNTSQAQSQQRLFPDISVDFLDVYELPKQTFQDSPVGGLSGITYNPNQDQFYVISDDRSQYAPARFYTLALDVKQAEDRIQINEIAVEDVTFLQTAEEQVFPEGEIDAEGIAFAPDNTVVISSEGNTQQGINPFVKRFDLATGKQQQTLPLPDRFLLPETEKQAPRGVRNNLAFESLTVNPSAAITPKSDPFRVFTATESSLAQDQLSSESQKPTRIRFLHYIVNPIGQPVPIAEHLYLMDKPSLTQMSKGLTEMLAIPPKGNFLSLERSYGLSGYKAKLFLVAVGDATDTSGVEQFNVSLGDLQPLRKQLLFDFSELDFDIYNVEGLAMGPQLPDGSQSLLAITDDNFKEKEKTQIFLFRLNN